MNRAVVAALASSLLAGCASHATPAAHPSRAPRLLVTDVDADPLGLGGNPGAVFEIDAATRAVRVVAACREFRDPVDVLADPDVDGGLLVLDLDAIGGAGHLWRVSPDGAHAEETPASRHLVDPTAMARGPDGSLWVTDRGARFPDGEPGPGALLRFRPDLATCEVVCSGAPLLAPSDVVIDGTTAWLLDADALRRDVADLSEGALFRVDAGERTPKLAAALHLVSPLSLVPEGGGRFLVVDVNADPQKPALLRGAVYRVDASSGAERATVATFARDDGWRDPSAGLLWSGQLLVVDGSSDPLRLGPDPVGIGFGPDSKGRGGVYSVDLATRAVTFFAASPQFVNPGRIRLVE
jgi:hypothetical protein